MTLGSVQRDLDKANVCVDPALSWSDITPNMVNWGSVFVVDDPELRLPVDVYNLGGRPGIFWFPDPSRIVQPLHQGVLKILDILHRISSERGVNYLDINNFLKDILFLKPPNWARSLERFVDETLGERRRPRNIFYIASSHDLASAVVAFKDADVYVLVDSGRFLEDGVSQRADGLDSAVKVYQTARSIRTSPWLKVNLSKRFRCSAGGNLPLIMAKMRSFFPSFRVRRIQSFSVHDASHGIMIFDLGEGTRPKTLVYLNITVKWDDDPPLKLEGHEIPLSFVDGILVKGDMALMEMPNVKKTLDANMRRNGGVVIEGVSTDINGWYYGEMYGEPSDRTLPEGASFAHVARIKISYKDATRLVAFPDVQSDLTGSPEIVSERLLSGGLYVVSTVDSLTDRLRGGRMQFSPTEVMRVGYDGMPNSMDGFAQRAQLDENLRVIDRVVERARLVVESKIRL